MEQRIMKDGKAFDFLSENGWENIPPSEREAFRRRLSEAQGKRDDQTDFSHRVAVACAIGMLLALLLAALTSCSQAACSYRKLYRKQIKTTRRAQNAHLVYPKTKVSPWRP